MAGIYSSPSPSSYPIEKIGDSPYPYPYPVNAEIPRQNGKSSDNTHGNRFIYHLYSLSNWKFTSYKYLQII